MSSLFSSKFLQNYGKLRALQMCLFVCERSKIVGWGDS